MKRWIAVALFACLSGLVPGVHARTWVRGLFGTGAEEFRDVAETWFDDSAAFAGYTTSFGQGGRDLWVVKYDVCGTVEWERTYGGQGEDQAEKILATTDGGFLVVGNTTSFGSGGSDVWILKLDADGNLENDAVYGGQLDETAAAVVDVGDGYVVVANVAAQGGIHDVVVLRLKVDLSIDWSKTYGGNGNDEAAAIVSAGGGTLDLVVAGSTDSFGVGDGDFWILRISELGEVIEERSYHGLGVDIAHDLERFVPSAPDPTGYIVVGETIDPTAGREIWLLYLEDDLSVHWSRTFGGSGEQIARSVSWVSGPEFVIAGETDSAGGGGVDLWLLRLDSAGNVTAQKSYGGAGDERAHSAFLPIPFSDALLVAGAQDTRAWALRLEPDLTVDGSCSIAADTGVSGSPVIPTIGFPQAFSLDIVPGATVSLVTPLGSLSTANLVCTGRPSEVSGSSKIPTAGSRRFIEPLIFTGETTASWEPAASNCSDTFNIYTGDLFDLAGLKFGVCFITQVQQSSAELTNEPSPGQGLFYLVSGVNEFGEGVLGFTSSGVERAPELICP